MKTETESGSDPLLPPRQSSRLRAELHPAFKTLNVGEFRVSPVTTAIVAGAIWFTSGLLDHGPALALEDVAALTYFQLRDRLEGDHYDAASLLLFVARRLVEGTGWLERPLPADIDATVRTVVGGPRYHTDLEAYATARHAHAWLLSGPNPVALSVARSLRDEVTLWKMLVMEARATQHGLLEKDKQSIVNDLKYSGRDVSTIDVDAEIFLRGLGVGPRSDSSSLYVDPVGWVGLDVPTLVRRLERDEDHGGGPVKSRGQMPEAPDEAHESTDEPAGIQLCGIERALANVPEREAELAWLFALGRVDTLSEAAEKMGIAPSTARALAHRLRGRPEMVKWATDLRGRPPERQRHLRRASSK